MRRAAYISIIATIIGGVMLVGMSPDVLSMAFTGIMLGIICVSVVAGILPLLSYSNGFRRGLDNIYRIMDVQTESVWTAVVQIEGFFRQKMLDSIFEDYKEKVKSQKSSDEILSDIEEYVNEDVIALHNWNSIMVQIPGTLTGLGILGTFIGLVIGISGVGFSSVEAALESVQSLMSGIEIAFYTSIVGVIFSIVFNIIYRMVWNMTLRQMGVFVDEFHKHIIPPVEEQKRTQNKKEVKMILDKLERLPKDTGYSLGNNGSVLSGSGNEQILMPQILQGLKDGEFTFYLQPKYDLNIKKVIGAEALVRWSHSKLGLVPPALFIPVLEANGYITKLDQYIWEQVCVTIRRWIDSGIRPLPISVNVSKTDVLAIDVGEFFSDMIRKYHIPPRYLDIEVARNVYTETHGVIQEVESSLRQSGFKVIMDGFDGDFIAMESGDVTNADCWKLDLRYFMKRNQNISSVKSIFDQARKLGISIAVEGVENMEQVSVLKKCGCTDGQGYYFSKPVAIADYEETLREK